MSQIASAEPEEGNNQTSSAGSFKSRKWVFTLNNYTVEEEKQIHNYLLTHKSVIWIYGFEIAPTTGTPHLQGYLEFKNQIRQSTLWKHGFKRAKLSKANGTLIQNYNYCSKDCNFKYGRFNPEKINYKERIEKFFKWEEIVIEELKEKPNDRTINWIWEPEGCTGKTTFQKWIFTHMKNVAVLSGKSSDMKNGIVEFIKQIGETPDIVLINIPRCVDDRFISFEGIESIKDMFFYSGKYEGLMVCGKRPHLYIFANTPPKTENMSRDRWVIRQILNRDLV